MESVSEALTDLEVDRLAMQAGVKMSAPDDKSTKLANTTNSSKRKKKPATQNNNIIVRLAKPQDLEPARAIARALHEKTVFAHIPWSDRKFDRQCDEIIKLPPNKVGLVAELNGKVLGFAFLTCGEYFIGEGHIVTTVQTIAVDSDNLMPTTAIKAFMRLIEGAKKWAATRGEKGSNVMVVLTVTSGVNLKATDRILRKAGAKCVGGGYVV